MAALVALVALILLAACSESTDPGGGGGTGDVSFHPAVGSFEVFPLGEIQFEVRSTPPLEDGICWQQDGQDCGTDPIFHYQAQTVGTDTVLVTVDQDGKLRERQWLVFVYPDTTRLPGVVPGVTVSHAPAVGEVRVTWNWVTSTTYPISTYEVAMSTDGPVSAPGWDQATLLGAYPHDDNVAGYEALYGPEDHGLPYGTEVWFAVRAVDQAGQLSPIHSVYHHVLSRPWVISGMVVDDSLRALEGVVLDYGSDRTNSLEDGSFTIGPVSDAFPVNIYSLSRNVDIPGQSFSSWYDVSIETLSAGTHVDPLVVPLIARWGMSDACPGYQDDFLTYLREMTKTMSFVGERRNYRLYRWAEYPVPVFISDHTDEDLDFGAQARLAIAAWNEAQWGEEIMVETADSLSAGIIVEFGSVPGNFNGVAILEEPGGGAFALAEVVPERIRLLVNTNLPTEKAVQSTTLHEMGHALGLANHATCQEAGYLMYYTTDNNFTGPLSSLIHLDERRAVRTIRRLPQGFPMDGFTWTKH